MLSDRMAAPSSLSDLTLTYCRKAGLGQISRSFSLNRPTIRLKRSKNLTPTGLPLDTIGQVRRAASLTDFLEGMSR